MKKAITIIVLTLGIGSLVYYLYGYEMTLFVKAKMRDRMTIHSNLTRSAIVRLNHKTEYNEGFEIHVSDTTVKFSRTYGRNDFYVLLADSVYPLRASYFKKIDWAECDIDLAFDARNDSLIVTWRRVYNGEDDNGTQRFFMK